MTNLKYDPNQHGMVVIQIPIFDLNDHLWVMESDKCICCERPNRGDPRGPSTGNPREHMPRHRTRMDGGDCDFFSKFLEVWQDLAKNLNDHQKNRPNQHGMMAIQIIYLDLNDHLRGMSKFE